MMRYQGARFRRWSDNRWNDVRVIRRKIWVNEIDV